MQSGTAHVVSVQGGQGFFYKQNTILDRRESNTCADRVQYKVVPRKGAPLLDGFPAKGAFLFVKGEFYEVPSIQRCVEM